MAVDEMTLLLPPGTRMTTTVYMDPDPATKHTVFKRWQRFDLWNPGIALYTIRYTAAPEHAPSDAARLAGYLTHALGRAVLPTEIEAALDALRLRLL